MLDKKASIWWQFIAMFNHFCIIYKDLKIAKKNPSDILSSLGKRVRGWADQGGYGLFQLHADHEQHGLRRCRKHDTQSHR